MLIHNDLRCWEKLFGLLEKDFYIRNFRLFLSHSWFIRGLSLPLQPLLSQISVITQLVYFLATFLNSFIWQPSVSLQQSTYRSTWNANIKTQCQTVAPKFLLITQKRTNALTVRRLEELSVLTQYLFHSISNNLRSREDLKYETSSA